MIIQLLDLHHLVGCCLGNRVWWREIPVHYVAGMWYLVWLLSCFQFTHLCSCSHFSILFYLYIFIWFDVYYVYVYNVGVACSSVEACHREASSQLPTTDRTESIGCPVSVSSLGYLHFVCLTHRTEVSRTTCHNWCTLDRYILGTFVAYNNVTGSKFQCVIKIHVNFVVCSSLCWIKYYFI